MSCNYQRENPKDNVQDRVLPDRRVKEERDQNPIKLKKGIGKRKIQKSQEGNFKNQDREAKTPNMRAEIELLLKTEEETNEIQRRNEKSKTKVNVQEAQAQLNQKFTQKERKECPENQK